MLYSGLEINFSSESATTQYNEKKRAKNLLVVHEPKQLKSKQSQKMGILQLSAVPYAPCLVYNQAVKRKPKKVQLAVIWFGRGVSAITYGSY